MVVAAHVTQEGLTKLKVIWVVVHVEGFVHWERLLLKILGNTLNKVKDKGYFNFWRDIDFYSGNPWWDLELNDEILIVSEVHLLDYFSNSDLIDLVHGL